MHGNEPYPPEMAGFFSKISKGIKRAFTPPKKARKAWKKIRKAVRKPFKKPLVSWKTKDVTKAFKKIFVVPGKVREAFHERGFLDAFEVWLDTEVDPIMSKFGRGETFITPTDVLLAPLSLLVPGSGTAVSAGLKASADVALKVGAKAAAWHAVKTAAIKAAPTVAGEAVAAGMDYTKAKKMERDMEKLAKRAEREEVAAVEEERAFRSAALSADAQYGVRPAILPVPSEPKSAPVEIAIAAAAGLIIFKYLEGR